MAAPLRFDGRVVLVTGAGNGLGKQYALDFAARGASVVVNDLGGDFKGQGKGTRAADVVVEEIRSKGGKAVPNYDSVEEGEKLIQTALENFGRIDVIVNNAGILRDKSLARISDLDWDLIHRVHLRGAFQVTRAAWPHMKKQNYGRIINVTSSAGIYGNFGQANYSAAKLGIVGFTNTLAIEGKKNNIKCNVIAPMAGSRMTETVMPPDLVAALKPEFVAPLVVYLGHESCPDSGSLLETGAGWIGKLRWQRTQGAVCRSKTMPMSAESVRDNWELISDFTDATFPKSGAESTGKMMSIIQELDSGESVRPSSTSSPTSSSGPNIDAALSHRPKPKQFKYSAREVMLYNLGVGSSTKEEDYLKFLFEGAEDFCVLPSFAVIPAQSSMENVMTGGIPGFEFDPTKLLHGEQYIELYKPLPVNATLTSHVRVADLMDKGSGAVVLLDVETVDEKNEKVCFNQFSLFVVGAGKFGGKRNSDKIKPTANPPSRSPDASIAEKTSIDQAALYRLSGDRNPLHIDPSFAAMGGFSKPILHGLCSFGFATRHVVKQYCNNDVKMVRAIKARFVKPVYPGQTLQTDMWKEGNRIHFQCKVAETGDTCLGGAYIDLNSSATPPPAPVKSSSNVKSNAVFEELARRAKENPGVAEQINAVFQFDITQGKQTAATWTADIKSTADVYSGPPKQGKADCVITMSDDNFMELVTGKLNGQQAFMNGLLKIKGNMMLAQKLGLLFQPSSKM